MAKKDPWSKDVDNYIIADTALHPALDCNPPGYLVYPVKKTDDTQLHKGLVMRGLQVVMLASQDASLDKLNLKSPNEVGTAGERYVTVYSRNPIRMAAFMLFKASTGYLQWAASPDSWSTTAENPVLPSTVPDAHLVTGSDEDRVLWLRTYFDEKASTLLQCMYQFDADGSPVPAANVEEAVGETVKDLTVTESTATRVQPARRVKQARGK